jgi:tRNA(Ile)-lysidine synthase
MQKKIVYIILEQLSQSKKDITAKHVESVLELFHKAGMKYINLPYNLQAKSEYDEIVIEQKAGALKAEALESELDKAKGFTFRIFSAKMPDTIPEKRYTKWFDYDKIEKTVTVRTRREGDFLLMQNGQHRKTLNRYFIDEKVPKDQRDEVLLVADGSHILWVVGQRISDYYKVTKDTEKIIDTIIQAKRLFLYSRIIILKYIEQI